MPNIDVVTRLKREAEHLPESESSARIRAREALLLSSVSGLGVQPASERAPRRAVVVVAAAVGLAMVLGFASGYVAAPNAAEGGVRGPVTLQEPVWTRVGTGSSIQVPAGWDGRVLFTDPTGTSGVVLQVANFALPSNTGFDPPVELPPGEQDPIKAMPSGAVLITVEEAPGEAGAPSSFPISLDSLRQLSASAPRVPVGHSLHQGTVCDGSTCAFVTVDFGTRTPSAELMARVDDALSTLLLAVSSTSD